MDSVNNISLAVSVAALVLYSIAVFRHIAGVKDNLTEKIANAEKSFGEKVAIAERTMSEKLTVSEKTCDQRIEATRKECELRIEATRKECELRVEKLAESESKSRHDLRGELTAMLGRNELAIEAMRRDMVSKQDQSSLESRLIAQYQELKTAVSQIPSMAAQLAVVGKAIERIESGREERR